jgi:hypothetical protein
MTQISDLATLQAYLTGMMEGRPGDEYPRIEHAAYGNLRGTVLTVAGGLAWRADPGSIRCRDHRGRMANIVWATVNGHPYCFAYNRDHGCVEVRDRNERGPALFEFNDQTPSAEIWWTFANLGRQAQEAA